MESDSIPRLHDAKCSFSEDCSYYTALFTNFIESLETTEFILKGDNAGGGFLAKLYEISFWDNPGIILIIQIHAPRFRTFLVNLSANATFNNSAFLCL